VVVDCRPNEHIRLAEYDRAVGVLTDVTERLL
jgi:hypothetical protein